MAVWSSPEGVTAIASAIVAILSVIGNIAQWIRSVHKQAHMASTEGFLRAMQTQCATLQARCVELEHKPWAEQSKEAQQFIQEVAYKMVDLRNQFNAIVGPPPPPPSKKPS